LRHPPGVTRCVAPLLAVSFGLAAASPLPASAAITPPPAPTYLQTIGGRAHATMYPSGVDAHKGTIYIADTGNDQVAAYRADGTRRWRVGTRGPKQPGSFNNPRDIAYRNGRLYVADTGYNRVQVLNAKTGAWIATWPHQFQSVIGISAGPNGHGGTVILTADDDANTVAEWTTSGELVAQIAAPLGKGNGQLDEPRDADTDSHGNIYVADFANDRMAKFGPGGKWLRNWGTKGAANGQFARPYGVAIDATDHVYVADSNNERIQEFTRKGRYVAKWGRPGDGPGQFTQLRRVAVGGGTDPKVYGADLWGNHVSSFKHGGAFVHRWGTNHPAPGGFNEPSGLAVGTQTYVADTVNQRMERFTTATGVFNQAWGARGWEKSDLNGFNWPRDVTLNTATNTVWVADTKNNRLTQFSTNGTPTGSVFGHLGSDSDSLHWPFGIASAGSDVVVADTFNNRVERIDGTGLTVEWNNDALHSPRDLTVADGVVYVADSNGNSVVELDASTGHVITSFGGLHNPQGIAVAGDGNIWVADTASNRLVEFSPGGAKLQALGAGGGATGTAHGTFNHPTHLEIWNGALYVADEYNDRIEAFTLND
jgi:tripartite motif-containing protein 71